MDIHAFYNYKILEHLEQTPNLTNRIAAEKLGVSVKLTHGVFRKLVKKGWIYTTKRDGRSLFYFLTPKGIAEKVRLTYEFLDFTRQFYQQARRLSSEVCQRLAQSGARKVALLGTGDLAEIVYLGIAEHRLRLTHVFDLSSSSTGFMGMPVLPATGIPSLGTASCDRILVALYDPKEPLRPNFLPEGILPDDRFVWAMEPGRMMKTIEDLTPLPSDEVV